MVGNPFEEGLGAPLALALLADRLYGQIPTLLLWSDLPQPLAESEALAATRRVKDSRYVIPPDSHKGRTGSAHNVW